MIAPVYQPYHRVLVPVVCDAAFCVQVDIKNRKHFLKKCRSDELKPELLFIGSTVTVYSRQLKLIDYGDEYSRRQLEERSAK